jgi:hypothetical protein
MFLFGFAFVIITALAFSKHGELESRGDNSSWG